MQAVMGVPFSAACALCIVGVSFCFTAGCESSPPSLPTHPEQQLRVWASISVPFRGNVRGQCT